MNSLTKRLSPAMIAAATAAVVILAIAALPGSWGRAYGQTAGDTRAVSTAPAATAAAGDAESTSALAAFSPSALSASTPPAARSGIVQVGEGLFAVNGSEGGVITLGEITLIIPPGALPEDARFISIHRSGGLPSGAPPLASGTGVTLASFGLELLTASRHSLGWARFIRPVTLVYNLSPEAVARAGGSAANSALQFFDELTNSWKRMTCSNSERALSCSLTDRSVWALTTSFPAGPALEASTAGRLTPAAPLTHEAGASTRDAEARTPSVASIAAGASAVLFMAGAGNSLRTRLRSRGVRRR